MEIGVSLETPDRVRRLQRKLYVKAKHEPSVFTSLADWVLSDGFSSSATRGEYATIGMIFDT
jgi:hypothetical protein